jgi:hypothetical protein
MANSRPPGPVPWHARMPAAQKQAAGPRAVPPPPLAPLRTGAPIIQAAASGRRSVPPPPLAPMGGPPPVNRAPAAATAVTQAKGRGVPPPALAPMRGQPAVTQPKASGSRSVAPPPLAPMRGRMPAAQLQAAKSQAASRPTAPAQATILRAVVPPLPTPQRAVAPPPHARPRSPAAAALCLQMVTAYRAQGGSGFESRDFLRLGGINPERMGEQFNISVGDILHARYFAKEKRGGVADVFKFEIDDYFFDSWLVRASTQQHRANSQSTGWQPPDDNLRDKILTGILDFRKLYKPDSATYISALGPWAGEPIDRDGAWRPIPRPRIGDTEQPSYKVEMAPPWPFLMSLFIRDISHLQDPTANQYDPASISDPNLLDEEMLTLSHYLKEDGRTKWKVEIRHLSKLHEEFQQELEYESSINNYNSGIYEIYDKFQKIKRRCLPSHLWWEPFDLETKESLLKFNPYIVS